LTTRKDRKFKTSIIAPFAANVQFVAYECGGQFPENRLVEVLVNERQMVLPGCEEYGVFCPLSVVNTTYASAVGTEASNSQCQWDSMCGADACPTADSDDLWKYTAIGLAALCAIGVTTPLLLNLRKRRRRRGLELLHESLSSDPFLSER
jgi:hypothetical protein